MENNQVKSAHCKCNAIGVRITAWCLCFTGFVLSCLVVTSCKFIELVTLSTYISTPSSIPPPTNFDDASTVEGVTYMGLFSMYSSTYNFCIPYEWFNGTPNAPDQMSSAIKASEAFGALAAIVGGVITLSMLITVLFTGINKCWWLTMASFLVANTVFQLLTFAIFNHDLCKVDNTELQTRTYTDCSVDEGAAYAISAAIFYLLGSIAMFLVPSPRSPLVEFEAGWRHDVNGNENHQLEQSNKSDHELAEHDMTPNHHIMKSDVMASVNGELQDGQKDPNKRRFNHKKPAVEL